MRKIYIIIGTCGEYSDRSEWPVVALTSEASAEDYVIRVSAQARLAYQLSPHTEGFDERARAVMTLDPGFQLSSESDYTRNGSYYWREVPFYDEGETIEG